MNMDRLKAPGQSVNYSYHKLSMMIPTHLFIFFDLIFLYLSKRLQLFSCAFINKINKRLHA